MKKTTTIILAILLVLALSLSLASCGKGKSGSKSGSDGPQKFLLVSKIAGIPYYDRAFAGAEKAGKDLGVEVVCIGPVDAAASEQVKIIEDALAQGYTGIGVAANDAQAFVPIFKKAQEMGIVTCDWDSPVDPSVVDYSILNVDDVEYANLYVEELVRHMGPEGEFVWITGGLNATNLNTWMDLSEKYMAEKYPGLIKVTDKIPTDERADVAYQKTTEVVSAYPNLKAIMTQGSPVLPAAAEALSDLGLGDKMVLVGNTTPNAVNSFVKSGIVNSCLLWDPAEAAYAAVALMKAVADGTPVTDGMELNYPAGPGKIKLDGIVVTAGAVVNFSADVIDNYDF